MYDDGELPPIIVPNDPYWLLNVIASRDEPTPFHLHLLYHWQYGRVEKPIPTLCGYLS